MPNSSSCASGPMLRSFTLMSNAPSIYPAFALRDQGCQGGYNQPRIPRARNASKANCLLEP